jgi:alanine dehydrogenase
MHQETGERRDFLPSFVGSLERAGASRIVVEEGYGTGLGLSRSDYQAAASRLRFGTYEECLQQDLVTVIRCPGTDALRTLRPGAVLVTMLHVRTRPDRAGVLEERGVRAVSLDSVTDDAGRRLVETFELVAWNGVHAAFRELRRLHGDRFSHPSRRPIRVTCLGSGSVGGWAVHAATRYGDHALREELVARGVPGVEVTVVDFDLTWHEDYMLSRLEQTDLLIDATHRRDPSRAVVPNRWVGAMPEDAVILDLAADPYDLTRLPPVVKGIEGVPTGNLDQWVFPVDDPAFDRFDGRVDAGNRRLSLSCGAWPGIEPRACMEVYQSQLEPLLELILARPDLGFDPDHGTHDERALARGELSRWRHRAA